VVCHIVQQAPAGKRISIAVAAVGKDRWIEIFFTVSLDSAHFRAVFAASKLARL
jgi:predicted Co/Zn/Cd cation transporter (cation efflux family)